MLFYVLFALVLKWTRQRARNFWHESKPKVLGKSSFWNSFHIDTSSLSRAEKASSNESKTHRLAVSPLHGHPLLSLCEKKTKLGSTKMKIENFFLAPRLVLDDNREEQEPKRLSLTPWLRDFTPIVIIHNDRILFYYSISIWIITVNHWINNIHHVQDTATQPQEQTPKGIQWYVLQRDGVTHLL